MRLSKKSQYALRASVALALKKPPQRGLSATELAERTGVPNKFLEAILSELRKSGLVATRRGPDGGYWLSHHPSEITIGAILKPMEGSLSLVGQGPSPSDPLLAVVASALEEIDRAVDEVIERITLEELCRRVEKERPSDYVI